MVKVTLKDGKVLEVEEGISVGEVASKISPSLRKKALAAKINGNVAELMDKINEDCSLEILTFEDEEGRAALRHTTSHILAQAVKRLYPDVKLAIGPSIENGFYYDFDADFSFTPEILENIEKEMDKIVKEDHKLRKFTLPREEAIKFMKERNEDYKVQLIEDLPQDAVISFYEQGEFVDLCAGPHVPSTKEAKAIKLTSIAGAYWRGNENNKMLQRIYGTVFTNKNDLKEYLHMMEEAKKRDHRKIGREMNIFVIPDEGPGFPLLLPNGVKLKNTLLDYWREVHRNAGYVEIETPLILNRHLWENSGHWDHYKDNMYTVVIDDQDYAIKPMNCPGGMLAYKTQIHSYKELPLRVAEIGRVHRHELSGALHGLMRVRAFTQDDAHIFMLPEQIKDEIKGVANLIDGIYKTFGFEYHVELSTRPEDSMGTDEEWEIAENGLRNALEELGLDYKINEGDGAFYGPKIDFHLKDCIGRTWQCGTIQLDMQMPQRFDLTYIGSDGEKHRPVMIHRVAFGSIERFIGILIEHYAGKFPVWLAPVQIKILPISDKFLDYASKIKDTLFNLGYRVEMDSRAEKIGYKIREAQLEKVPYMLIIGEKEMNENNISVRSRDDGDLGSMQLDDFIADIKNKVDNRINTLQK